MHPFSAILIKVSFCIALLSIGFVHQNAAQQIATKKATVGAPKTATAPTTARAFPPPYQVFNLKESHLEEHHLRIPVGHESHGARAFKATNSGPETQVFSPQPGDPVQIRFAHPFAKLETQSATSTVSEPTLAVRGNDLLVTANWFTSVSKDGGKSFDGILPSDVFPQTEDNPFCCDQIAVYDPKNDMMIWILQYVENDAGNFLRMAVSKGADITGRRWNYYDLNPAAIGGWTAQWFDFPDVVIGENYLYLSSNVYETKLNAQNDNSFTRSVLMRIPLADLAASRSFTLNYFDTTEFGGLRGAQGSTSTFYFAANRDPGKLRIFDWSEQSASLSFTDVSVQDWENTPCKAPGPDGTDWLKRVDTRITAAWSTKDYVGFGWTTPQDGFFKFPQVRFAVIRKSDKQVVAQPILWNGEYAFVLPAASVSPEGRVGVSLYYGGNTLFPSFAVGAVYPADDWKTWATKLAIGSAGTQDPDDSNWGDFGAIRLSGATPDTWQTIGYSLQGGGNRSQIELTYFEFSASQLPTLSH